MPMCLVNGVQLYYEIHGSGPPIIFTHGHSMYHRQWEPQVAALSKRYQIILWDVRGHGHSSLPPGRVDPEDFSRDLNGLMDALDVPEAVLCGLSMGGHISIQSAIRYPQRVRGLILIGSPYTNTFNLFERLTTPISKLSVRLLPLRTTASLTAKALSGINPDNRPFIEQAFSMMSHDAFVRHWSGNLRMESKRDLHRVSCPTLVLYGDQDTMVMRQQRELARQIQGAELHVVSNAHHLTNRDNPEEVNRHVAEFMNRLKAT